ncbi:MAG: glycoside hydrolase family 3 C-terminal domain-containing protein, partial [Clostridium sp.]|nr:glycoside hydrolase family 3 C-terminal domain-containing protein [Clostridium sp.]
DTDAVEREAEEILSKMTLDEKLLYIGGVDAFYINAIDRLSLPRVRMSDGPQGVRTDNHSTAYPTTVLLAANWDDDMARRYGEALGSDCRANGVNIILGPAVNIYRAPFCGRNFEYMGEDPYLAGQTAANYIKGVQSQGVMATVKHFLGNNSDYDRNHISSDIDERTLFEIYLPAFRAAIEEGNVGAVMSSYNLVDGIYTSESPWITKDILRDRLGFRGMLMSDWGAVHHCIPTARNGLDLEMPGAAVMNAADIKYYLTTGDVTEEMIDEKVRNILRAVLTFGFDKPEGPDGTPLDNPESARTALDVARGGIVLLKNERNFLPLNPAKKRRIAVIGSNAGRYTTGGGSGQVSPFRYISILDGIETEAGEGSTVEYIDLNAFEPNLLFTAPGSSTPGLKAEYFANRNLEGAPAATSTDLRLDFDWAAEDPAPGVKNKNFSARWTGVLRPEESGEYTVSLGADDGFRLILDGETAIEDWHDGAIRTKRITRRLEAGQEYPVVIEYYQGEGGAGLTFACRRSAETDPRILARLADADLIVACVGFSPETEGEGFDRTFELPDYDRDVLEAISRVKTPAVAVVNSGGGVDMLPWIDRMKAVLWAGYAGQEGGTAVAEILYGRVNPSGKLPMTFERRPEDNPSFNTYHDPDGDRHVAYSEGIFTGYRGYQRSGIEPHFPFGHGLSYTTFRISDAGSPRILDDGTVEIDCRLTNTGRRAGAQVVQAYVGQDDATVERPANELKAFRKVYLEPGESRRVTLTLPRQAFAYYDTDSHDFVVPSGRYHVALGFSSADLPAKVPVDL